MVEEEEVSVSGSIKIPETAEPESFFPMTQLNMTTPAAKEWIGQRRENIRPWTTFVNTHNFKIPSSFAKVTKRFMKNMEYFQSNYLFVFFGLFLYCLLTSPLLLIAVFIILAIGYKLSRKQCERNFVIFGHELTIAEQYGIVAICSIPLFIWAGVGVAVCWVIGASLMILQTRASELYSACLKIAGLAVLAFILILRAGVFDFVFFFCLYYIGASFFIITLHAAFYDIEEIINMGDSYGLLEEV